MSELSYKETVVFSFLCNWILIIFIGYLAAEELYIEAKTPGSYKNLLTLSMEKMHYLSQEIIVDYISGLNVSLFFLVHYSTLIWFVTVPILWFQLFICEAAPHFEGDRAIYRHLGRFYTECLKFCDEITGIPDCEKKLCKKAIKLLEMVNQSYFNVCLRLKEHCIP